MEVVEGLRLRIRFYEEVSQGMREKLEQHSNAVAIWARMVSRGATRAWIAGTLGVRTLCSRVCNTSTIFVRLPALCLGNKKLETDDGHVSPCVGSL